MSLHGPTAQNQATRARGLLLARARAASGLDVTSGGTRGDGAASH